MKMLLFISLKGPCEDSDATRVLVAKPAVALAILIDCEQTYHILQPTAVSGQHSRIMHLVNQESELTHVTALPAHRLMPPLGCLQGLWNPHIHR
jgi:hypothetical protein